MKPLIIYHADCLDGAAAALAAWLKFGDEAEYRPASYGDPAPTDDEVRGRDVYVLDFSYPRAELVRMNAAQMSIDKLVIVDHHKTAQADLAGLDTGQAGLRCIFDMSRSGAALAWRYFKPDSLTSALPELFAYVQDRDLWRWELPHSKEVSAALAASGALTDFRALIPIYNDCRFSPISESLMQDGAAILRAERLMVEHMVATAEEVTLEYEYRAKDHNGKNALIQGEVFALAACSSVLQSEVGEALALESARQGRDAIGVVYYKDGPSGKWRVSLRSRDVNAPPFDVDDECLDPSHKITAPDVSAIAKAFGGGGHHRAAGCEVERLPWERGTGWRGLDPSGRCEHGIGHTGERHGCDGCCHWERE